MDMDEKLHFADFADQLLDWYAEAARDLPWRIGPKARAAGVSGDPYRIWLAEIMLQQTTVPHATRYYLNFTERWPTVQDLADAADADVMAAWAGERQHAVDQIRLASKPATGVRFRTSSSQVRNLRLRPSPYISVKSGQPRIRGY